MAYEKCEKCGREKIMYYREWCPICKPPKVQTKLFLDLFECMYHIQALRNDDYKSKLWVKLVFLYEMRNDTYVDIFNTKDEDITLLFETFGIGEEKSFTFFISW